MTRDRFDRGDYRAWNRRLVDHYFNPSKRGRQVRLSLDEETLRDLGGDRDDLVLAVLAEAENNECASIQDFGLFLYTRWVSEPNDIDEGRGETPPPFVAVLALYVLAVNHGGSRRPAHAFYDRLHDLLEHPIARIGSIEPSLKLWRSLESWTTHDRGRLGIFRVGIVGEQQYVGIPRRQILIAPREQRSLEEAFFAARLTPGSEPSVRRLHAAARSALGLLNRTRQLLARWPSDEAARDLLSEVRTRFEDWNAEHFVRADSGGPLLLPLRLELCADGSEIVEGRFQTELVRGLTDTDHTLTMTGGPERYRKQSDKFEMTTGDSESPNPIVVDASKDPGWAKEASWFDLISFEVRGTDAVLLRQASSRLVFERGRSAGLLREVEEIDIRAGEQYVLITRTPLPRDCPSIVGEFLRDWQRIPFQEASYRVFRAAVPSQEDQRHPDIRLVGGIPTERGKGAYLWFALPEFVVALPPGQEEEIRLLAHDEHGTATPGKLKEDLSVEASDRGASLWDPSTKPQTRRFNIAGLSTTSAHCELEVAVDGKVIASRGFYVDREPASGELAAPVTRDGLGLITESNDRALVRGMTLEAPASPPPDDLPVAVRPLPLSEDVEPDDAACQRVMQLMRTRHRLSWRDAKRFLPGCLPKSIASRQGSRYLIHEVQILHALGILELEEGFGGGLSALAELPPRMVLLPRLANRGYDDRFGAWKSHQAVLTGCWLPDRLNEVKRAAKKAGAEFHVASRQGAAIFLPPYRSVLATGPSAMERLSQVAHALEVGFDGAVPFACRLASVMASIDDLVSHPDWTPGRPADTFESRFFDPRNLGVSGRPGTTKDRYALWECRHPDRPIWSFFIVDCEAHRRLEVRDRQVARWFVRRQALLGTPIPSEQDQILIPLELRLPPLLERLLTLSSGFPPELKQYKKGRSPFLKRSISERFAIPAPPPTSVD